MRVVFMGTPDFAASILIELKEQHDVVAVYTRADAVRGRGKKLVPSPVKEVALGANIPVFEPRTFRDEAEVERLRALDPDVICVAAYGMILPQAVLDIPKHGCLNVHASLLPKYRGAAPIERAILNGDDEAGVCIMRMEAGLDTGDYCICRSCQIAGMNAERLTGELADKGAYALLSALYDVEHGVQRWVKQAEEDATWAPKIEKGELNLNPAIECVENLRHVQASGVQHPSKCSIAGKGVTVLSAVALSQDDSCFEAASGLAQGKVLFAQKRLFLGCADGVFEILEIKPDGKKEMDARSFAAGVQNIKSGEIEWETL